ncbi:Bug family tripartite tricarboxylate transporter substrate binding protein [Humitalea sp. 24SJ18S-53]|uniref:Bug family tripartite tricarboxylate transporter substrate binding protein n=1 Tax=Humitalea sp. 24SJ18S-53 TaxID=3422307 RepID=UPI003D67FC0F
MITKRELILGGAALAALPIAARNAWAAFPDRTITLVVPFAPGGSTDLAGRLMADRIGPLLGEGGRAVVDNRPGAGSALGADIVKRARPDGYTLLVGSASTLAVAPASGAAAARYHPTRDFTPIGLFGLSTMGLVVGMNSGVNTTAELVAKLRAEPGRWSFASSGVGGISHLAGEYFAKLAEAEAIHVPYRGGSQGPEAVMKGECLYTVDSLGSIVGQIRDGALRLLAVSTRARDPNFPDVPTIAQAALPAYEMASWTVLVGPAGLPPEVTEALGVAAARALNEPALRARLESTGTLPESESSPAATRAFLDREFALYQGIVQRIGLRLD